MLLRAECPPRRAQDKATAAAAAVASTVKKLDEWQHRKGEHAGEAKAAEDQGAMAGKVKFAFRLLGGCCGSSRAPGRSQGRLAR